MLHVELERLAPGIPKGKALGWWWDLQEGHEDHRFLTLAPERRVTELAEGKRLVEDEVRKAGLKLFQERLVARLEGYAIAFEGENTLATFEGAYTFGDAPGGTRVRLEADVHLRAALALGQPLARPVVEAILERDLAGHVDEMLADLGTEAPRAGTHKAPSRP